MIVQNKHSWAVSVDKAREIQIKLSAQINSHHIVDLTNLDVIGGADISFNKKDNFLYATIVFLDYNTLKLRDVFSLKSVAPFPYVPGYLSFREIPPLLELIEKLDYLPDVLLCDGQGIAHPRGLGLASHLGIILNIPTIGCAKSVLVGENDPPQAEKGAQTALIYDGRKVGAALRTRSNVKPVYVSVGHKIRLEEAIEIVLHCTPKFRIPEPIRFAHKFVNASRTAERTND